MLAFVPQKMSVVRLERSHCHGSPVLNGEFENEEFELLALLYKKMLRADGFVTVSDLEDVGNVVSRNFVHHLYYHGLAPRKKKQPGT
jgi:hypothetical protein